MKKFLRAWLDREFERFKPRVEAWFREFMEGLSRDLAEDSGAIGADRPASAPVLHTESTEDD